MPGLFDYDDGGSYDVPTRSDYERWQEEKRDYQEERQLRWDDASEEERKDGSWDCPY